MLHYNTIKPKNNDNRCFQYSITVTVNDENILKNPEKVSKLNCFLISMNGKK